MKRGGLEGWRRGNVLYVGRRSTGDLGKIFSDTAERRRVEEELDMEKTISGLRVTGNIILVN